MLSTIMGAAGGPTGPVGQVSWFSASLSTTWVCPAGVTSICAVCVGIGGNAQSSYDTPSDTWYSWGGSGGGLAWVNNIAVVPGTTYYIVIGPSAGSYFSTGGSAVAACRAEHGAGLSAAGGRALVGTGGQGGPGAYGVDGDAGGSGAGGYAGMGGAGNGIGGSGNQTAGAGGGGGGGTGGFGGGGVGVGGQGASGAAATTTWGGGGSGAITPSVNGTGGNFGGGGGCVMGGTGTGGMGAVRLIWGAGRSFPSTLTGDM